jgi:hypothetical protein
MPGPGIRGGGNTGNMKTPEQLAYEKAIKDAMIKKAMQEEASATRLTNQNNNPANNGMMQTTQAPEQELTLGGPPEQELTLGGPPTLTQAEDPWNLQGTRESTGNEGAGLFAGMSDWETATFLDSQGLLGDVPFQDDLTVGGAGRQNLLDTRGRIDRYNTFKVDNYNGPAFETTDDIYSYLDGLDLNTDRRALGGGRGGDGGTEEGGLITLKSRTHDFVNQHNFNATGQQPIYEEDGKIYVLNTGYGTNTPVLDGPIPFAGSGGMYHETAGSPQGIGEYRVYEEQNKQGPDTDLFSDVVMPAVIKAGFSYVAPWSGPLMTQLEQGGFDLGEWDFGDLAKDLGTSYVTSEYLQRIPGLEDTAGMFDLSQYAPTGWENIAGDFGRGVVDSGLKQLINDGEIDWSTLGVDGLVSVGQALIGDTFGDANQTSDNNMDLSNPDATQVYGGPINPKTGYPMDWKDIRATVSNTTDWRSLLGPEGVISQITGIDIPFMPTDWIGDGFDWLEDNGLGDVGDLLLMGIGQNPITSGPDGRVDERFFDFLSARGEDHGLNGGVYLSNPLDPNGVGGFG